MLSQKSETRVVNLTQTAPINRRRKALAAGGCLQTRTTTAAWQGVLPTPGRLSTIAAPLDLHLSPAKAEIEIDKD